MKIQCITLIISIFCCVFAAQAQPENLAVSAIPEALRAQANAVVRYDRTRVEITSDKHLVYENQRFITIFSDPGKEDAEIAIPYSTSFDRLADAYAVVYDSNGGLVKKLRRKEMMDVSPSGFSDNVDDTRLLYADLTQQKYPYTIEITYKKITRGLIGYPDWRPVARPNVSLEYALLEVVTPEDRSFRYKSVFGAGEPDVALSGGTRTHRWELKSLPAWQSEPMCPEPPFSTVYLAADQFEMDGHKGRGVSWEDFSAFAYSLYAGRDALPGDLMQQVNSLTAGLHSTEDKVRVLYQYMQQKTRYVFIGLGIGGWQPFEAAYVHQNGYGDCKALTNFMYSMLKAAGIPSHPALVYSGRGGNRHVQPDLPGSQFNHVILCVPQPGKDTIWLECTSNQAPAGYLGASTHDRHVLLLMPEGGKLVRTPAYPPEYSQLRRVTAVNVGEDGMANVRIRLFASGDQHEELYTMPHLSQGDQEKLLRSMTQANTFDLKRYALQPREGHAAALDYEIQVRNWAAPSGTRLFVPLNVLNRQTYVPMACEKRSQPVEIAASWLDTDTVFIRLPEGFRIESLPAAPAPIERSYGSYRAEIEAIDENTLLYIRQLRMQRSLLPPEAYNELRSFFQQVAKADKLQLVLNKKS